MDWTQQIDAYCERTDFSFWAEPVNAVTNAAFLIAAVWMWRRTEGVTGARVLCVILFVIGIGSTLFHTFATAWAAMADNLPILSYILVYIFLIHRDVLGLTPVWAGAVVLAFLPYAALVVWVLQPVPFFGISSFYWTVPILLVVYGVALRHRLPVLVRGFWTGAAILALSITFRSFDEILCDRIEIGTHFMWHILNAVMLGYMIHVYARHVLAGRGAGR